MIDLVVATPVFLDLTFVGLESLPALGEERFAAELLRSPGGGAITAVGATRLGLSTAVAAPLADDVAGDLVRALLAEESVEWIATGSTPRTPTTVVMPFADDRAMVTIDPGARASKSDVARRAPRAVAASLDQLYVVPEGTRGVRHLRRRRRSGVCAAPPDRARRRRACCSSTGARRSA